MDFLISAMDFLTIVIMAFAFVLALAGIFTTWYGSGKSRVAGILMLMAGLAVGVAWTLLDYFEIINVYLGEVILNTLIIAAGVFIGAIGAVAIFLIAVLKS